MKNETKNDKKIESSNITNNEVINEEIKETQDILVDLASETSNNETVVENEAKEDQKKEQTSNVDFPEEEKIPIEKNVKKSKPKKVILTIISIIMVFVIVLVLSTIFAIVNLNNTNILSGISVSGIDISNLSKEEASAKVSDVIKNKLSKEIILYYGNYEVKVIPEQFQVKFDVDSSIASAYYKGRSNNVFKDNFEILNLLISKYDITPSLSYNEDALDSLIAEMQANIPDHLVEPSYYTEGNNLIITKGQNGIKISSDMLKKAIINNTINLLDTNNKIEIPVTDEIAKNIDIDAIYSEVYREAKDAYYTKEPFAIYPHTDGIDFAISVDEAKAMLTEDKESYTIPLKVLSPKVTTNQIGTEAFPDLLGSFTTKFSTSNVNRSTNIRLASQKINGIVIMPGETFSYNQTVGKRTAAAGFKSAAVYAGGKVTTGIGGGICQVSSTLYNAVLLANLEIVERQNHGFNPGYVKAGTDATVSWGGPDFKFKNNRNYPIKVVCYVNGGTIYSQIFGLKGENEYEVIIEATITSYIPFKTITENDNTLEVGQTKVLESGSSGCRTVTYKVLKQNGQVISRTLLSKDTYNPHHKIVAVGTKQPVSTPTTTPTPTPEPEVEPSTPETSSPEESTSP